MSLKDLPSRARPFDSLRSLRDLLPSAFFIFHISVRQPLPDRLKGAEGKGRKGKGIVLY